MKDIIIGFAVFVVLVISWFAFNEKVSFVDCIILVFVLATYSKSKS